VLRPEALNPLFAPVEALKGVGPQTAKLIARLVGEDPARVVDLLFHLPVSAIDRRARVSVAEAALGEVATMTVTVEQHRPAPPGRSRAPHRVLTSDGTADLLLVFFAGDRARLERMLPVGAERIVSGVVEIFDGVKQIVHPDHVVDPREEARLPAVEPVYPLTEGLTRRVLANAIGAALDRLRPLPDWIGPDLLAREGWPGFGEALRAAHRPAEPYDADPAAPARNRLAYDELLAEQIALALLRSRAVKAKGRPSTGDGRIAGRVRAALPFALTAAQERSLAEIDADMASDDRMLRLLQGDVGSGKTVVALLAMARAAEAGRQSALMAPTELLARQHHRTIEPLAKAAGLQADILTGREKGRERAALLALLAAGRIDILVGTHALLTEEVRFHDLGLVVVDEQHRFGVAQRFALTAKSEAADLLLTTATPIPRTLVMTYYGDMDVSRLDEKPAGRRPIKTVAVSIDRLDEVVAGVGRAIDAGQRCYWVCPLVEESESLDEAAAERRYAELKERFGARVGLLHGRMRASEKDAAIAAFASGTLDLLVATTVVEVGVDVPEATIMVIEAAERFGLAQLHQLRGRVGRGQAASTCVLLRAAQLTDMQKQRLQVIHDTEDGFLIAEKDLELRGPGEVLGTRQAGLPSLKLARFDVHGRLVPVARDDARLLVERDPELAGPRGEAARALLHLFGRTDALRLVEAG
jgi:ATP-dependent DNA helicase RecG